MQWHDCAIRAMVDVVSPDEWTTTPCGDLMICDGDGTPGWYLSFDGDRLQITSGDLEAEADVQVSLYETAQRLMRAAAAYHGKGVSDE